MSLSDYACMKSAFYKVLQLSGVLHYARRQHRDEVLILTYHGVLKKGTESYVNRNFVSQAMFEAQLRWLRAHYHVLPLAEIIDGLAGKRSLPPFPAAITFDGGYRNNYTVAFPLLLKYNLPATVFLTTNFIGESRKKLWVERVDAIIHSATARRLSLQMNGNLTVFDVSSKRAKVHASDHIRAYLKSLNPAERERKILSLEVQVEQPRDCIEEAEERYAFLSWDEVRTMAEGGIEFGSHTASHAILSTLSSEDAKNELRRSKEAIETQLGRACELFSYPNGQARDFCQRDQALLQELGFRAAFTQICGFNRPGDDLLAMKRINIVRSKQLAYFVAKITGVQPLLKNRCTESRSG